MDINAPRLKIGTEVILLKDIPQNAAKAGMIGTVKANKVFEFSYCLTIPGLDKQLPVYWYEIDPIETLDLPDQLSIL